jgi:hypothetical protein
VDLRKFNATTNKKPYLLPFINEVINTIVEHELYTFLDGFLRYHHILFTPKTYIKSPLLLIGGFFVGVVMKFLVQNGPPTYQRAITQAFHEYIDVFMKIFLDDFTIFNDLSTHLKKFTKCFFKCREFDIKLNPNKCAFMVFLRTILGFIIFKKGKVMDPNKVQALINMPIPTTP